MMIQKLYRTLFSLGVLAIATVTGRYAAGQEPQTTVKVESSSLFQVGDNAPKLQVDHWLGESEVQSFSKDNVYVVEFWATWCAPCIKSMPHLSELAERYSKDGLVVIALTTVDEANTREAIEQFINDRGKDFRFRYAVCERDSTYKAYMEGSGQQGIPCSFVIDRDGKLAYVGHPHDLDYVLERVMSGKWRGKVDADEVREMGESISKLGPLIESDPDKAFQIVEHIRRVNPKRTKSLDFAYAEVLVLCKKKMFDRAKEVIDSMIADSGKAVDWGALAMVCSVLASKELNPDGQHRDFALAKIHAGEEALKDDWQNLIQIGISYRIAGDGEKFKECTERVIQLCPDEQIKKSLRSALEIKAKLGGK